MGLTAAFLAAMYEHGPELDSPLELSDLSPGGDSLEVTPESDGEYATVGFPDSGRRDPDYTVNTVADLNRVVPLALAHFEDVLQTNGGEHNVTINRDGSLQFGCKHFTDDGVKRVVAAAKRVDKGLRFPDFRVNGHNVQVVIEEDEKGKETVNGWLDFDGDEIEASVILDIAREREAFLKQKPTPKVKWTIDG